jgi:hypothetical protein
MEDCYEKTKYNKDKLSIVCCEDSEPIHMFPGATIIFRYVLRPLLKRPDYSTTGQAFLPRGPVDAVNLRKNFVGLVTF